MVACYNILAFASFDLQQICGKVKLEKNKNLIISAKRADMTRF
jgi:hypothetical protein